MSRAYNFSAGPAVLPEEVLREVQADLLDYKGSGMSIMESSHRGKEYAAIHDEAVANVSKLLGLGDEHAVLFMGGGATTQFALLPMNLRGKGQPADYVNSGSWATKAIKEAKITGETNVIADTSKDEPARMPDPASLACTPGSAYLHITSNETIAGTQWKTFPKVDVPLVADISSDALSRPLDMSQFGMVYAGAQKNLGPAGVTLIVVRKDLAERVGDDVPMILRYTTHIEKNSLYNTPPCFPIYVLALVTRWILANGGLEKMAERNKAKAAKVYEVIDGSDFFRGTAEVASRSDMNITFRLPSEEQEAKFIKQAAEQDMKGLKGHRSVGGIRASVYNAFPEAGIDALVAFMKDFESKA